MPKKKPVLKLVKSPNVSSQDKALDTQAPNKKSESKGAICKEFNCSDKSQVSGYCRLHFLKLLKQSTAAAQAKAEDKESADEGQKKSWNRRRGNRVVGLDQHEEQDGTSRDERIQQLGALDDDFGTILETEEISPFKKAS